MPTGRFRSRTFRRIKVRTPGGNNVMHYKLRKPKSVKCALCGGILKGTARERPSKLKKLPKTKRRPTRPFGGNLCTKCMRKIIKQKARSLE